MSDTAPPEPDRVSGAPHPRETHRLFGQDAAIQSFLDAYGSDRLHSGWMITGQRGIGKATLAWKIARFLLAQPTDGGGMFGAPPPPTTLDISDDHPDARLLSAGAHPRLYVARRAFDDKTEKLKAEITVEVIRGLKNFFQMSAADGGRRVVIVDAADEMNRNAANAILKELEEPPKDATLLLVAHQPSRLLPTIRSRCRVLRCQPLSPEDFQSALDQAGVSIQSPDVVRVLSNGSVGDAIRILQSDGLSVYEQLTGLFAGMPSFDRPAALKLAESCAGRGNETRFSLTLDLIDLLLSRLAQAGLMGEPNLQGAPGEALLLSKLSPDARSARRWAEMQQVISSRARHGRAVNLDPASLILDILFSIEDTAHSVAAA